MVRSRTAGGNGGNAGGNACGNAVNAVAIGIYIDLFPRSHLSPGVLCRAATVPPTPVKEQIRMRTSFLWEHGSSGNGVAQDRSMTGNRAFPPAFPPGQDRAPTWELKPTPRRHVRSHGVWSLRVVYAAYLCSQKSFHASLALTTRSASMGLMESGCQQAPESFSRR